jgi:hypothetical protein
MEGFASLGMKKVYGKVYGLEVSFVIFFLLSVAFPFLFQDKKNMQYHLILRLRRAGHYLMPIKVESTE